MTAIVPRRISPLRAAAVTLGLIAGGAVFGAIAGTAALALALLSSGAWVMDLADLSIATVFGAILGALVLPFGGWALLRQVPLGRVVLGSVLGTVVGGVAGWWTIPLFGDPILAPLGGALVGFLVAAVVMRRGAGNPPRPGEEWQAAM